jgi:hypothetical protein
MSIDNEVTLVKKINSYYKEQLEKKVNFNIDLELDFFCRYETEKEKLIDLDIII